jgi:ATP-binding cassette subfamily B protein
VSFHVRRGDVLGIVGDNGAGKSTLVKLLMRLYEPTDGRILINGLDAARFTAESVQREMSAIFQDYGQFFLLARENVGLSRTADVGDTAAIEDASRRSGAALNALPQGWDTPLGSVFPNGHQLSGGQWQRLALARLCFRPCSVRILDEPTAALDPVAEASVANRIYTSAADAVSFVITHRLPAVRLANHIIVLKQGRLIEAGTHEALLAAGGAYATLFHVQAAARDARRDALFATGTM